MRFVVNILRTSRVENPSFHSHEPDWVFLHGIDANRSVSDCYLVNAIKMAL